MLDAARDGDSEIWLGVAPAYDVYVQLFSGDWPDEGATVEVTFGQMRLRLERPAGPGSWWRVGSLRPTEASLEVGGMLAGSPW
ncbi:hypothetical protein [Hansschlegelia sp. KR7-227]|uniref:hypothetical protein n=1 Tax=Hansschlegelia sp. KR7-227 TaxID=3400914 RepID=UPI003BFC0B30